MNYFDQFSVELIRLSENRFGTFGVLRVNKIPFCVTLEPQDLVNQPNTSCIPPQSYDCKRHMSPRFGETFLVLDVPDRSNILFHAGNTDDNTKGCILLGESFGKLQGDLAILNSGKTFKSFMFNVMDEIEMFNLTILTHL